MVLCLSSVQWVTFPPRELTVIFLVRKTVATFNHPFFVLPYHGNSHVRVGLQAERENGDADEENRDHPNHLQIKTSKLIEDDLSKSFGCSSDYLSTGEETNWLLREVNGWQIRRDGNLPILSFRIFIRRSAYLYG